MSMSENGPQSRKNMTLGTMLGQYRLEELVASGGMARIYKAVDTNLERKVAVKVLMPELIDLDDTLIDRFEREAKAVAQLEHDNIVRIYDYRRQNDRYYIVMNYIEGHDLADELNKLRRENKLMDVSRALRILGQVAGALDFAHAAGIIHRDVKPSNVLLTQKDKAILTDFGLVLRQSIDKTMGTAFGTPRYIAPEQALASENSVPQSDIYSLAVIIYEILTGQMLFFSENPMQIAMSHINQPPTPPRSINPAIPMAAERELLKALAKNPVERHRSASEFVSALKKAYREVASSSAASPSTQAPQNQTGYQTLVLSDDDNSRELLQQPFDQADQQLKPQSAGDGSSKPVSTAQPEKRRTGDVTIAFTDVLDADTQREAALLASWDDAPAVPAPALTSAAPPQNAVPSVFPTPAKPNQASPAKITAESKSISTRAAAARRRGSVIVLIGGIVVALVILGAISLAGAPTIPAQFQVDEEGDQRSADSQAAVTEDRPPVLVARALTLPPAISPTTTALPTLTLITGGQPVRLDYDEHVLMLRNLDGAALDMTTLEFAKPGAEVRVTSATITGQTLPTANCVGFAQSGHTLSPPEWDCTGRAYYDEVSVSGQQLFWRTAQPGQFEVRLSGAVIAYCTTVQRGARQTCEFNLPASSSN